MNDIERIKGRLFKHYSVIADVSNLSQDQIKYFLALKSLPKFQTNITIKRFQETLFGPGALISYVHEKFNIGIPGQTHLAGIQFSPVYAGRIALATGYWKNKLLADRKQYAIALSTSALKHSEHSAIAAEKHQLEITRSHDAGYVSGQTRGVLTGIRHAVEYMIEYSEMNSLVKYGPGMIKDVEEWLLQAEAVPLGTPLEVEKLIIHMVGKFTERMAVATRFKNVQNNSENT